MFDHKFNRGPHRSVIGIHVMWVILKTPLRPLLIHDRCPSGVWTRATKIESYKIIVKSRALLGCFESTQCMCKEIATVGGCTKLQVFHHVQYRAHHTVGVRARRSSVLEVRVSLVLVAPKHTHCFSDESTLPSCGSRSRPTSKVRENDERTATTTKEDRVLEFERVEYLRADLSFQD